MNNLQNLKLCIGPMFASKTTEAIKEYKENFNTSILAVPSINIRDQKGSLSTHDNISSKAVHFIDVGCIDKYITNEINLIIIDECQFVENLFEICNYFLSKGLKVSLYGLNLDYKQKFFKGIKEILPFCLDFKYLKATCNICEKKNGEYSLLKKNNQVITTTGYKIGGENDYYVLCKQCFSNQKN